MKHKIVYLFGLLAALTFGACSSDNDPEFSITPEKEYELILGAICDENGEIPFAFSNEDSSQKIVAAESEEAAIMYCRSLLNDVSWNGKKATRTVSEGYGFLTVNPSEEEGIFYSINFNIKDIEPFTLTIVSEEFYNNDNFGISRPSDGRSIDSKPYFKCPYCPFCEFYYDGNIYPPCPNCGKK